MQHQQFFLNISSAVLNNILTFNLTVAIAVSESAHQVS